MNRLRRSVPALLAVLALVVLVVGVSSDLLASSIWKWAFVAIGAAACTLGAKVNGMPILFAAIVALGGARVVTLDPSPTGDRRAHAGLLDGSVTAIIGLGLVAVTAVALRYRRGNLDRRDSIDLATVSIGASLVGWLLVAGPLVARFDVPIGEAIVAAAYLPIAVVLFTSIVDLLLTGLHRNGAMRLVALSALANLVGATTSLLGLVGTIDVPPQSEIAFYGAAFLLVAAGISHRDALETITQITAEATAVAYTPFRLALAAACLFVPTVLAAMISPVDGRDLVVRVALLVALIATVVARLSVALSSHERAQRALLERLHCDDLTGLPTRKRLVEVLTDVLETTWRSELRPTIIQLNLDRFKNINDSLGHTEANRVLFTVAERLAAVADGFGATAARVGGDDFAIVDSSTRSDDEAMQRVEAVRAALAAPITGGDHTVFVTASIGVAVAPRNRTVTAEEMLRRADIATNKAKTDGRSGLSMFDDSMQAHLAHRMDVEQALHGAIGRREMRLYYQPIVDVATGLVRGFEALMRWERDGVIVSPLEFISIAEETGIINELGAWALDDALGELRRWIDDDVVGPDATVSVNVSPRQIADPDFAGVVRDALERNGVASNLLWLEVTESMMLEEPELARNTLRSIRDMGVRLALDDFGTGYSSLSVLQQFPIHRIKIDRAFVQGIAEQGNDRSLVRTIIAMAQSMGLDLVAEGVETVQQLQALAELSCDKAQGYLISHPVPADAMRSTMVALDELTSLSLFTSASPVDTLLRPDGDAVPGARQPVAAAPSARGRSYGQSFA